MIATRNESGAKTFRGAGPIEDYRIVRVSAGPAKPWDPPTVDVALADSVDVIGSLSRGCGEAGDPVTCWLRNKPGSRLLIATEAIDAGAEIYLAAGGKVAASGTVRCGLALSAATQAGDYIEGVLTF